MPTHLTKIEHIIQTTFKGCSPLQVKTATQLIFTTIKEDLEKAQKWDALDAKIAACYPEDDEEIEEERDLVDIGEMAASAFGYL